MTELVSQGALPLPDRVVSWIPPPGSIPKTSEWKVAPRRNRKQLYLAGKLAEGKAPAWLQITRLATAPPVARTAGAEIWSGVGGLGDFVWALFRCSTCFCWIVPTWTIVNFIGDYRKAGRFTSAALKILFVLIGCRVRVVGKEYMERPGAKVFAANHTSYFDVLPLMLGLGVPYHFVAKMEVGRMPFIGTFLTKMKHTKFNRNDSGSRLRQMREMEELLRDGESVFVFPEGTFTGEDGVRPFRRVQSHGGCRCSHYPGVAGGHSKDSCATARILPRPTSVTITVSPPIYPRVMSDSSIADKKLAWQELVRLRDATREAIAPHTGEPLL